MNLELIIAFLLIALFCSNVFWAMLCLKLTNKLMSRNYFEYVQAEALKSPKVLKPQMDDQDDDPEAERQAREINSLMGMV